MNFSELIIPLFIAFGVCAVSGPFAIPALRRMKFSQTEREFGPESHLKKAGTPTMGGIMILLGTAAAAVYTIPGHPRTIPVFFLMIAFGVIGFVDDYLKVVKRNSDGLMPRQKLLLEFAVTAVYLLLAVKVFGVSLGLYIPFTGGRIVSIGFLAIPLLFFAVLGTVNAVNFTDGLDGLASSVTIVVSLFFAAAALITGSETGGAAAAVIGALMAFLLYNSYPASVFMGDTGSLALGGFVAGMAYILNMPLFILIVGIIYFVEIVSVMMQVTYFKATGGKRIFKMTPIHHHFEKSGWSETRIVAVFTVITALAALIGILAL